MSRDRIVIEEHDKDADPATCGGCDWTGPASQVRECHDAILTPGDTVPLGRCPRCQSLVYLARPKDAATDAAGAMLTALRRVRSRIAALSVSTAEEACGAAGDLGAVDRAIARAEGRA